jgi:hypothetical protein
MACFLMSDALGAESRDKPAAARKAAVSAPRTGTSTGRPSRPPSTRQALQTPVQEETKKSSEVRARKSARRSKVSKKHQGAMLKPKPDLSYHGILYRPQRYDPSRGHRRTGGAPNPHAGELVHDHFLELDRNRDGSIDPMERTLGRLDLDRDLANRRWK